MPTSALELLKPNGTDHTDYLLVGSTAKGASYKDPSRSLALPLTLDVSVLSGPVGSKGNDHVKVKLASAIVGAGTSAPVVVGSVTLDISIPRDANWTDSMMLDLLANLRDYLDNGNITFLVDGIVP